MGPFLDCPGRLMTVHAPPGCYPGVPIVADTDVRPLLERAAGAPLSCARVPSWAAVVAACDARFRGGPLRALWKRGLTGHTFAISYADAKRLAHGIMLWDGKGVFELAPDSGIRVSGRDCSRKRGIAQQSGGMH